MSRTATADYLSPREAAERFAVSTRTIRRRIEDGTLPAVRLGARGPLRIHVDVLEMFVRPAKETK